MHVLYDLPFHSKERKAYWEQLVTEWKASGFSEQSFCVVKQIKEADLKRWVYRLSKIKNISAKDLLVSEAKENRFIPLEIIPTPQPIFTKPVAPVKLTHTSGWSIELDVDFDECMLSKVIGLFSGESC